MDERNPNMPTIWKFQSTPTIIFGSGSITQLPGLIKKFKAEKIAIITDQGIVKAGLLEKVSVVLSKEGLTPYVYDQAMPEPSMESVLTCFSQVKAYGPDVLIALGGGSCMDLAKMSALLLAHGGHPSDYFGENKVPGEISPIIAIPTTAGTGSEVSAVAVVTDDKTNLKIGISDNYLRPRAAVLDPELTLKLPSYITACTGMDALSQAIEAYFSKDYRFVEAEGELIYQGSNPLSDILAEKAIKLIGENLVTASRQGSNLEARTNMLLGNLYSALAVSNSGTSLSHALAYPIAEKTRRPHGEIIGLLLPYIIRYNASVATEKFAVVAELLGEATPHLSKYEKAQQGADIVFRMLSDLGMPQKLSQIGIERDGLRDIVEKSLPIERLIRINPRTPTVQDVEAMLLQAL
jgi:alcohol dehydrogenase class IV